MDRSSQNIKRIYRIIAILAGVSLLELIALAFLIRPTSGYILISLGAVAICTLNFVILSVKLLKEIVNSRE